MKLLLLLSIALFPLSSCQKQDVHEDLGNGFSMIGTKDKGRYIIKKNGIEVAQIDLSTDHIDFTANKSGANVGYLSTPLNDSSGRGCSAVINIRGQDGEIESHLVYERRLEDHPRKGSIVRGAAVYDTNAKPDPVTTDQPVGPLPSDKKQ